MLIAQLTPLDTLPSLSWLFTTIRFISLISYLELSKTCDRI
jgi:hypothetical protein